MTVLVTGASGFVGRHLVAELLRNSYGVRVVARMDGPPAPPSSGVEFVKLSGIGYSPADWEEAVSGCKVVVHLAARVHVGHETHGDPDNSFRLTNVCLTAACAAAAAGAGVERFVFMSTIGVHGGASGDRPFHAGSDIAPHTPYASSKAEAERVLAEVVDGTGMSLTVLRPPLVYGSGAPGNFGALARAVARGCPLPFARVTSNRRSFVAVDNLVDLIVCCAYHPAAANQTFLVSDGFDLSTYDLLSRMGSAMGYPARLLPAPIWLLSLGAKLSGKREMFQSLCGSLQVDMGKTRELLGWSPRIGVDEGLKRAVGGMRS